MEHRPRSGIYPQVCFEGISWCMHESIRWSDFLESCRSRMNSRATHWRLTRKRHSRFGTQSTVHSRATVGEMVPRAEKAANRGDLYMTGTLQDSHLSSLPNGPSTTSKPSGTRSKLILNKSISEKPAWPLMPQRGHLRYSTHDLPSAIPQYARVRFATIKLFRCFWRNHFDAVAFHASKDSAGKSP